MIRRRARPSRRRRRRRRLRRAAKERASFAHEAGYDAYMTGGAAPWRCTDASRIFRRRFHLLDDPGFASPSSVAGPSVRSATRRSRTRTGSSRCIHGLTTCTCAATTRCAPLARGVPRLGVEDGVWRVGEVPTGRNGWQSTEFCVDAPKRRARHRRATDDRARNDAANDFDARFVERALRAGGLRAEVISSPRRRGVRARPRGRRRRRLLGALTISALKRARDGSNGDGSNGRKRARGTRRWRCSRFVRGDVTTRRRISTYFSPRKSTPRERARRPRLARVGCVSIPSPMSTSTRSRRHSRRRSRSRSRARSAHVQKMWPDRARPSLSAAKCKSAHLAIPPSLAQSSLNPSAVSSETMLSSFPRIAPGSAPDTRARGNRGRRTPRRRTRRTTR